MKKVRRANDRGHLDFGWLNARHTFSFGSFFDPEFMGFKSLRVMNNDRVQATKGFDTHPHKDMEIITFLIEGELSHRDTLGNNAIIKPGEIQIMSAGSGIFHSEFNSSETNENYLYQIWIIPSVKSVAPRYEQYSYEDRIKLNDLTVIANPTGGDKIAKIYQDTTLSIGRFEQSKALDLNLNNDKGYWLQVIKGSFEVDGEELFEADGICFEDIKSLSIKSKEAGEFLFFELA
jgi:redox-sensitive bicupin YhaK (pirin superfamily)